MPVMTSKYTNYRFHVSILHHRLILSFLHLYGLIILVLSSKCYGLYQKSHRSHHFLKETPCGANVRGILSSVVPGSGFCNFYPR